ncbi:branched-chain amino acid ABC transporter permease [Candidatus Woesearchaeota archaeon]|nr:branched-chain amino acid ABC transporter permease [Candidatus Woesearchaeota archaeon]
MLELLASNYALNLLILICIYVILAVSLNLIVGFSGMLNLGHAAFFGIGAYASALLALAGYPYWLCFIAAIFFAGLGGALVAYPSLKLRGDYLAIATLGFGEIARAVMKNWVSLTRGPLGLPGIPKISFFGLTLATKFDFFIFSLIIAAGVVFFVSMIVKSPFGRVLRAIREDEIAAQAIGKNVKKYKVITVIAGAACAGIAGSLFAHHITFIDPTTFTLMETVLIICMVVLGGVASIRGSIVGAAILVLLPEPLRFLGLPTSAAAALRVMIYAVVLILLMVYRPNGIFGEWRFKHAKSKKAL